MFFTKFPRYFVKKVGVNSAIQSVRIHGIDTILKAHMLVFQLLYRFSGLLLLSGMTGLQRLANLSGNPVVHFQPAENLNELPLKSLLTHILTAA
ncbi:MAG: hypothetical protein OXF24_02550 [Hyphomicrobiales bacterium]|nr:hypothetical protein [Hyphomicrobiales bacterium]